MPKSSTLRRSIVAAGQEQVLRLDVAVDDAALVRVRQRLGRPARQRDRLGERDRLALQARRQVLALQPLHGDEALARLGDAVGQVAHDRRVGQPGQDRRLLLEARRLAQLAPVQDLDRDGRPVGHVAGAVHRAHPARAGLGEQLKPARYDPADHALTSAGRR